MDGMLLQTVEAIGDSPFVASAGEIWETLQAEKEAISRDLLADGKLTEVGLRPDDEEPSAESEREIEWRHRETLEDRLRAINDAQDRLIDGGYGMCVECGAHIGGKRLLANPAAALCLVCQEICERGPRKGMFRTL